MAPRRLIGVVMELLLHRLLHRRSDAYVMINPYTIDRIVGTRTNIEIDDELLSRAMTATGLSTKRATVEEGLQLLVGVRKQAKALAKLKGWGWEGDLDEMGQGRSPRRP